MISFKLKAPYAISVFSRTMCAFYLDLIICCLAFNLIILKIFLSFLKLTLWRRGLISKEFLYIFITYD